MFTFLSKLHPRYIIAATLGVVVLMFTSAIIELKQSREELLNLLHEHSVSLAETIANSSSNIVLSTDEIERQISERLLNNAHFVARLDSMGILKARDLRAIADENNIFRINIFDRNGMRVLSNHEPLPGHKSLREKHSPQGTLKSILSGETKQLVIGLKEARFGDGQRYAVAVARTHRNGGAIVLNLDAAQLVEFRKSIGIGKLVKDLGNNSGIEYVVLQDGDGILAASLDVREMSRIEHDSAVLTVLNRDTTITRQASYQNNEVFEVIKRLAIDGALIGVLRIGLSMDEIRATDQRMQRRLLVMAIVLSVLGILIILFIVASRNFKVVSRKFETMQLLTAGILENMRDAVVAVNEEGRISVFNRMAEELFTVSAADGLGKRPGELSMPARECLEAIFKDEEPQFEQVLKCAKGEQRIVSVTLSTTKTADGSIESRTAVIKDLTQAKQLEREIRRREKLTAMGELASGVAHEIRNPLNAISMIAQRYQKEFVPVAGAEEYHSLTQVLKKEAARVNNIIRQFLNFARPPAISIRDVNAANFVLHITALFRGQADAKNVRFLSEAPGLLKFRLDPEQMTQALLNLLQNALDATSAEGEIRLNVYEKDHEAVLEVTDTGSGIPEGSLEKIFNLYYTTKETGTGMGLAITQQIVAQHNGRIEVHSSAETGTSFRIFLPV